MGSGSLAPRSNHRTGEEQEQANGLLKVRRYPTPAPVRACRAQRARIPNDLQFQVFRPFLTDMDHKSDQADRAISTGQLNALPRLHIQPINVVVFHGSDREYSF